LYNFFELYYPIVDNWMFINNSGNPYHVIAEGEKGKEEIVNNEIWKDLKSKYHGKQKGIKR
jgi:hypothetical protein